MYAVCTLHLFRPSRIKKRANFAPYDNHLFHTSKYQTIILQWVGEGHVYNVDEGYANTPHVDVEVDEGYADTPHVDVEIKRICHMTKDTPRTEEDVLH